MADHRAVALAAMLLAHARAELGLALAELRDIDVDAAIVHERYADAHARIQEWTEATLRACALVDEARAQASG